MSEYMTVYGVVNDKYEPLIRGSGYNTFSTYSKKFTVWLSNNLTAAKQRLDKNGVRKVVEYVLVPKEDFEEMKAVVDNAKAHPNYTVLT